MENSELYDKLIPFTEKGITVVRDEAGSRVILTCAKSGESIAEISGSERSVRVRWCLEDMQAVRPDLRDEECMNVLRRVVDKHDATIGISWETLDIHAADIYGVIEKPEMYGKFVKHIIDDMLAADGWIIPQTITHSPGYVYGGEISFTIAFHASIEKGFQFHHWHGGEVVGITVTKGEHEISGVILANGDIRARLGKGDTDLCYVKDKGNNAGFNEMRQYIEDDTALLKLISGNVNNLSLLINDCNWWEFIFDCDEYDPVVLDSYPLNEAIVEAVAMLSKIIITQGENE
jgi:hypothetical protein